MKKNLFAVMMISACLLAACGSNDTKNESVGSAQTAAEVTDGYCFESGGVKIIPDMEATDLLDVLGDPVSYFEARSCAFGDQDKQWTYNGFYIDTYQLDGVDYIYDVVFTDDTVETPEGIYLGKTKDDVKAAYGDPSEEEEGYLMYRKGNMKLIFILEEGKVVSIEYDSMVLDKDA